MQQVRLDSTVETEYSVSGGCHRKKMRTGREREDSPLRPLVHAGAPPANSSHPSHPVALTPLPLTRENLSLFTGDMPQQPNPSRSTTATTKSKANTTQGATIQDILEANYMPMEDQTARNSPEFKDVEARAKDLLARERHSPLVGGESNEYWFNKQQKIKVDRNEQTFREEFWRPFVGRNRNVKEDEGSMWIKRAWEKDGLDVNGSQRFHIESLPRVETGGDMSLAKLLKAHERVKTPEPDYTYALDSSFFTPAEKTTILRYHKWAGISKGVRFPSVIVEFKQTDLHSARAQCARGGAALIHANRQLISATGQNIYQLGTDTSTVVYSFAITYDIAKLQVHWAQVLSHKRVIFHMHRLRSYIMGDGDEGMFNQRRDLNNLLEWTVGGRRLWVQDLLSRIQRAGSPDVVPMMAMEDAQENESGEVGGGSRVTDAAAQESQASEGEDELMSAGY
ncbi:MAG: hypothetical protein Q9163_005284 [Psora crenata]